MTLAVAEYEEHDRRYHHIHYKLLRQTFSDWLCGGVRVLISCDVCDVLVSDFMTMDRLGSSRSIDLTTPKAASFFEQHHVHDPNPNDVTR